MVDCERIKKIAIWRVFLPKTNYFSYPPDTCPPTVPVRPNLCVFSLLIVFVRRLLTATGVDSHIGTTLYVPRSPKSQFDSAPEIDLCAAVRSYCFLTYTQICEKKSYPYKYRSPKGASCSPIRRCSRSRRSGARRRFGCYVAEDDQGRACKTSRDGPSALA
jgi:hypothetical protein